MFFLQLSAPPNSVVASNGLLLASWKKQALYGEPSKRNRIDYPIRHQVQKLLPDG